VNDIEGHSRSSSLRTPPPPRPFGPGAWWIRASPCPLQFHYLPPLLYHALLSINQKFEVLSFTDSRRMIGSPNFNKNLSYHDALSVEILSTAAQLQETFTFGKVCSEWITLKVTQGHVNWLTKCHFLLVVCNNNDSIMHHFGDIATLSDCVWPSRVLHVRKYIWNYKPCVPCVTIRRHYITLFPRYES